MKTIILIALLAFATSSMAGEYCFTQCYTDQYGNQYCNTYC